MHDNDETVVKPCTCLYTSCEKCEAIWHTQASDDEEVPVNRKERRAKAAKKRKRESEVRS